MTHIVNRKLGRTCRGCGCTDNNACVTGDGPCCWVLLDVDTPTGVCSACAEELEWTPVFLAQVGTGGPHDPAAMGGP